MSTDHDVDMQGPFLIKNPASTQDAATSQEDTPTDAFLKVGLQPKSEGRDDRPVNVTTNRDLASKFYVKRASENSKLFRNRISRR